jgi:uroporphyrinogen III methyltransferase/synthase
MVYLVGAGPGEPGCLTLRGRECLERADVVIYDYLANAELLRFVPEAAERIFGGKHGVGPHLVEQSEINRLMIDRAQAGKVVVRLKGGDPLVFGRGGEEAEALAAAGLRFEIVPGVTAALAVPLFAGIPVTHRDWVSGVTILTGHEAPEKGRSAVHWEHVATAGNTIVLLMGVTQLRANLTALLAAGLPPSTPAAAIRWGTTPQQRVLVTTAGELAAAVERERLRPPVTVVIGEVVRLRRTMGWFERRELFGKRILVTRTRAQAGVLSALLAEEGAQVIEVPAIELAPPESFAALDAALARLESYTWVIFTSVNGVERFFARLYEKGGDLRSLHRARLAAIGPETARALERRQLRPDLVAREFRAEGILAELATQSLAGERVLLPRAAGARSVLPDELRKLGAEVEEVETYRSVRPAASVALLRSALDAGPFDYLTFTSSSTVTNFLVLCEAAEPGRARARLASARVACIGPVTAATALDAGLPVHVVPGEYTIPALAAAIVADLAREGGDARGTGTSADPASKASVAARRGRIRQARRTADAE